MLHYLDWLFFPMSRPSLVSLSIPIYQALSFSWLCDKTWECCDPSPSVTLTLGFTIGPRLEETRPLVVPNWEGNAPQVGHMDFSGLLRILLIVFRLLRQTRAQVLRMSTTPFDISNTHPS
jgi:hypothetical protein